jgi:uncharacterized membrane protein YfcA
MDFWIFFPLFSAGIIAGGMSAIAGGASFFTFPALVMSGLPPLAANATNFVALAPSNIAALPAFRSELRHLGRAVILPVILGASGGLIGSLTLIAMGGGFFASAVPYLMATATILFAIAPYIRTVIDKIGKVDKNTNSPGPMILLFVFSIYGGYFGAGLGQITMAALILNGHDDFHTTNALKNLVISAIGICAVLIYSLSGVVSWYHALIMMAGAAIGGYLGGSISKYVPQRALRLWVIILGSVLTIYYFLYGV